MYPITIGQFSYVNKSMIPKTDMLEKTECLPILQLMNLPFIIINNFPINLPCNLNGNRYITDITNVRSICFHGITRHIK